MTYIEKITATMEAHGWTAMEYARRSGIRESTIYALVSGRNADVRSARNKAAIDMLYDKMARPEP
jgi:predicted transcriptional regulator